MCNHVPMFLCGSKKFSNQRFQSQELVPDQFLEKVTLRHDIEAKCVKGRLSCVDVFYQGVWQEIESPGQ